MRKILLLAAFLLASAYVASYLRMFDPHLALLPWYDLFGKSVVKWLAAAVFYPVFELLYSWPAYVIGGVLFAGLIRRLRQPTAWRVTALGAGLGFSIYQVYAYMTGEWVMSETMLVVEQLGIYTIASGFFGYYYHLVLLKRPKSVASE